MKSSWKTTLAGLLTGGGILFAQQFPQWSKWGLFASGVGAILTGLCARDNDKTSEDVGASPTAIPARPRSMLAPLLAAVLLPAVLLTGCTTALKSDKIVTVKQRVFGVVVETSSSTSGTPNVKLGLVSTVFHMVPTSTNQLFAAPYVDSYELQHTANPFALGVSEDASFGNVRAWSAGETNFNEVVK